MGDQPCPIIPAPKVMKLEPSNRPWPSRFEVVCQSDAARPLARKFAEAVRYPGSQLMPLFLSEGDLPREGYRIRVGPSDVTATASALAGFRHALATWTQLASEEAMPIGEIEDYPALPVRGFHVNFASYRRMGIQEAVGLIKSAAALKLNTLLVEYGPRFPFEGHAAIRTRDAISLDDVERLRTAAEECGIEVIPLQQGLAHLEYVLALDRYASLREQPHKANLMCPNHPDALCLVKELMAEVIARHPAARYFHMGGDEARKVGQCARCQPISKEQGVGTVYGRHMGTLARWLLDRGMRPILWDDTLCAFPDAIGHLPKETVINYWDYIAVADPTPVLIPRMAHAAGGPRVAHDWRWSVTRRRGRLSDVQIGVLKNYSHAARLPGALGGKFMQEFGRYLGKAFPRWVRALPYLEYYQDRGHDVITSPTGMGNGDLKDGAPNFARFNDNIATHARRCKENGKALGMITTTWYNMPPELLFQPLVRTAMCAW